MWVGVPGDKENGAPALLSLDLPHTSVCSSPRAPGAVEPWYQIGTFGGHLLGT